VSRSLVGDWRIFWGNSGEIGGGGGGGLLKASVALLKTYMRMFLSFYCCGLFVLHTYLLLKCLLPPVLSLSLSPSFHAPCLFVTKTLRSFVPCERGAVG
jgi:hypothetical protein